MTKPLIRIVDFRSLSAGGSWTLLDIPEPTLGELADALALL